MAEAAACPLCKKAVELTVFGTLPKHGEKKTQCIGTGYTPKEASAMVAYAGCK
jgi:hypothetical protein